MTAPSALPPAWVAQVARYPGDGGPTGQAWLAEVPRLIDEGLRRWDLVPDGLARTGWTAVVFPVRRKDERLALKVVWPHPEAAHEHLALRAWGGRGAVRLVAADPAAGLLLLQRLDPQRTLVSVPVDHACRVIGTLLAELHRPAGAAFTALATYLADHLARLQERPAVPRRIVDRTLGLARELLADPGNPCLLHSDLHYQNVLGAPDGGWAAIDPKPLAGHPGFELYPLLDNRIDDLDGRPLREAMRRRVVIAAEAMGLELDEAFAWTLLRAGIETSWASVIDLDGRRLTHAVAVTKALDE